MHCLKRALPLLKPEGGILMLDNSEREWCAFRCRLICYQASGDLVIDGCAGALNCVVPLVQVC